MSYTSWSVVAGEKPTAAKWNIIGDNMAAFHDGSGFDDKIIRANHLEDGTSWVELADTDQLDVSIPTGYRHLQILLHSHSSGGDINLIMQFNNDSGGSSYFNKRFINNDATPSFNGLTSGHRFSENAPGGLFAFFRIYNVATRQKYTMGHCIQSGDEDTFETFGYWDNSSVPIESVQINNTGSGSVSDFDMKILGHV